MMMDVEYGLDGDEPRWKLMQREIHGLDHLEVEKRCTAPIKCVLHRPVIQDPTACFFHTAGTCLARGRAATGICTTRLHFSPLIVHADRYASQMSYALAYDCFEGPPHRDVR